jgi:hypothetical protein
MNVNVVQKREKDEARVSVALISKASSWIFTTLYDQ